MPSGEIGSGHKNQSAGHEDSAPAVTTVGNVTFRAGLPPWILRGLVLGVTLLGLAAMINAVDDWRDSRFQESTITVLNHRIVQLNDTLECRFDITQPVEDARAQLDAVTVAKLDALSLGLVALTAEDEAAVAQQAERLRALSVDGEEAKAALLQALQDRASASRTCDPGVPPAGLGEQESNS
jgi:hypothetical protein